jgi:HK97 family phage portal protein
MGLLTEVVKDVTTPFRERNLTSWSGVASYISGRTTFADGKYETYAREGYTTNALVFACIEELASSASEPSLQAMQAGKWRHYSDGGATAAQRLLELFYGPKRLPSGYAANGVNPFMDCVEFFRTVILHRALAGNAYALKVRSRSGKVVELWLLRPDRVTVVPDSRNFIARYEYLLGAERLPIAVEDIVHWKTSNPLSEFYGMPPLAAVAKAVDLDNFSLDFVSEYFQRAGIPAGMLSTKSKLTDDLRKEIKERFTRENGGRGNWHGLMVLDGADASYTAMTQSLGTQGLVLPELNKIVEARITGAFGVPPTLVGAVIGTEASSYGNKKSERESFWNETLKPLYRDLGGPMDRSLVPEYPGVQSIAFDLSTVGALQEDDEQKHARVRADVTAGLVGQKEGRRLLGYTDEATDDVFFIPSNLTQTPAADVGTVPALPAPAAALADGGQQ